MNRKFMNMLLWKAENFHARNLTFPGFGYNYVILIQSRERKVRQAK